MKPTEPHENLDETPELVEPTTGLTGALKSAPRLIPQEPEGPSGPLAPDGPAGPLEPDAAAGALDPASEPVPMGAMNGEPGAAALFEAEPEPEPGFPPPTPVEFDNPWETEAGGFISAFSMGISGTFTPTPDRPAPPTVKTPKPAPGAPPVTLPPTPTAPTAPPPAPATPIPPAVPAEPAPTGPTPPVEPPAPPQEEPQGPALLGTAVVKNDFLNVRDSPSTRGGLLGQLTRNDQVPVLERVGEWYKILYQEQPAYIFGGYAILNPLEKNVIDPRRIQKIQAVAAAMGLTVSPSHIIAILEAADRFGVTDPAHLAYILATVQHESRWGEWMVELADGTAYEGRRDLGNLQPGDGPRYKGRGYVQLTGRVNYHEYGQFFDIPLEENPDLAVDPELSAQITVHGMVYGKFTTRKLFDYGAGDSYDFVGARAIINANAAAEKIAGIARAYYRELR